jgi:hypothetical protein
MTNKGPVIGIFRQYAYHGVNRTIHSSGQLEAYKNHVDDRSMKVGGTQCVCTKDGYVAPLDIINGLPYFKIQPRTDQQWIDLPHVLFTGGNEWDPRILDHTHSSQADWYNVIKQLDDGLLKMPFDKYGRYKNRTLPKPVVILDHIPNADIDEPADLRVCSAWVLFPVYDRLPGAITLEHHSFPIWRGGKIHPVVHHKQSRRQHVISFARTRCPWWIAVLSGYILLCRCDDTLSRMLLGWIMHYIINPNDTQMTSTVLSCLLLLNDVH